MNEARFLGGGIGVARNHRGVPMLDFLGRMLHAVLLHPIENFFIVVELVSDFFEGVAFDPEKCEKMFVEADRFVVVAVE